MGKIKKEEKITKEISKETYVGENIIEVLKEPKEITEKKERFSQEEIIAKKELRDKIENMDLDDNLKQQAQKQAENIKSLKENEKIKNLLKVAQKKGIVFAVNMAKNLKDPYILDTFHDILAEKEYYKKFTK